MEQRLFFSHWYFEYFLLKCKNLKYKKWKNWYFDTDNRHILYVYIIYILLTHIKITISYKFKICHIYEKMKTRF